MKKILVTTDFSANSKAGIRFAIQMASQQLCELTFLHVYYQTKPYPKADKIILSHEKHESKKIESKLDKFVSAVYKGMGLVPSNLKLVISYSFLVDAKIMSFAAEQSFDFICISRNGESKLKNFFGTNTSNLILHSEIPVIAVPDQYKPASIKSVLYATDLSDLEKEISVVLEFANLLGAEIELIHLNYPSDIIYNVNLIEHVLHKFPNSTIKYNIETIDLLHNLVVNLHSMIKKYKPSLLIMFTDQNQGFLQKLFLSSSTASYSLNASVPLVVYPKKQK